MVLTSKISTFFDIARQDGFFSAFRALSEDAKKLLSGRFLFTFMTAYRYKKQQFFYDTPANPYKIITVRPDRIEYYNQEIDRYWGLGIIRGGGWDHQNNCTPVRDTTHYTGLQQHFEEGLDWEETVYVQNRLRSEGSEDLSRYKRERLRYFEDLFYAIKENGYRPNHQSGHDAPEGGDRQGRLKHVHALEVLVTIGRNGEVYLNEGFHRCAIAKFLDIEQIPVNVLARHEEWQEKREMVHSAPDPDSDPQIGQYVSHPDMRDVVCDSN